MKPGAEKLFNYLKNKSNNMMTVDECKKISPRWTVNTLKRIVADYPGVFQLANDEVRLLMKKNN